MHFFTCRTVQFNNRAENGDSSLVFAGPGLRREGSVMWSTSNGTMLDGPMARGGRTLRGPGVRTLQTLQEMISFLRE